VVPTWPRPERRPSSATLTLLPHGTRSPPPQGRVAAASVPAGHFAGDLGAANEEHDGVGRQRILTEQVVSKLTAALVATGEYHRDYPHSDYHLFGSTTTESVWRTLLVDRGDRAGLARTGGVVTQLLDDLAEGTGSIKERMDRVVSAFLKAREVVAAFDWRYYLARYGCMREGRSGIYYGANTRWATR
jgi:hypothetical protein